MLRSTMSLMMTSSNGNIFRATGHLCGEFTGHRWIPRTKASDAEHIYVKCQINCTLCQIVFFYRKLQLYLHQLTPNCKLSIQSKHTSLLNSFLGKWDLLPYLVVPLISARVPLISTRVSAHCQAILLLTKTKTKYVEYNMTTMTNIIPWGPIY